MSVDCNVTVLSFSFPDQLKSFCCENADFKFQSALFDGQYKILKKITKIRSFLNSIRIAAHDEDLSFAKDLMFWIKALSSHIGFVKLSYLFENALVEIDVSDTISLEKLVVAAEDELRTANSELLSYLSDFSFQYLAKSGA